MNKNKKNIRQTCKVVFRMVFFSQHLIWRMLHSSLTFYPERTVCSPVANFFDNKWLNKFMCYMWSLYMVDQLSTSNHPKTVHIMLITNDEKKCFVHVYIWVFMSDVLFMYWPMFVFGPLFKSSKICGLAHTNLGNCFCNFHDRLI